MTALAWEGCLNVRDLGGLPTEDGRRTRAGAVVRSDNIRGLTDDGWRALADHGVTRIVDLRWPEELAEDQPRDVDDRRRARLGARRDSTRITSPSSTPTSPRSTTSPITTPGRTSTSSSATATASACAFAAVADADGTVVVHCMGGKDRTGIVSALLLRLAGVRLDAIGEDYAVTAVNLEPSTSEWIPAIDGRGRARAKWREARRTRLPTRWCASCDEIERRYGDVASYLRAAGLTDEQIERLRERLVAP